MYIHTHTYRKTQCGKYKSEISLVEAESCLTALPFFYLSISLLMGTSLRKAAHLSDTFTANPFHGTLPLYSGMESDGFRSWFKFQLGHLVCGLGQSLEPL